MQPYFIEKALLILKLNGITETAKLALIKAKAYPQFLDVMAILFILNSIVM
jgi:SSS family solute:Na+ symporter